MSDLTMPKNSLALGVAAGALRLVASAEQERELFDGVCKLLVEDAGYALAWVGLARDDAECSVEPVARWGEASDYVESLRVSWADNELGRGPTGRAIRADEPMVLNRLADDSAYAPWLERASAHGLAASAAFPIHDAHRVVGALNVYASVPAALGELESELVCDVALALSMGLTRLRERDSRAAATEALQLARDNLEAIYDATPDMIFVHDGHGLILDVNEETARFNGGTPEEIKEAPPERLMGDQHTLEEATAHVRRAIEHGADDFTWVGRKLDGTTYPCEVRLRRLPGVRRSLDEPHVVAVTRDLTDLVKLQDELVALQRLESLAVLAGGIAHEFNNLLAGILGNIELARARSDLPDGAQELLDRAGEAGDRARALSDRLIGFARGGSRRHLRVDVGELVEEVSRVVFTGESVVVSIESPDTPFTVEGDREHLAQVFDNLFRNAVDAYPAAAR